MGLRSKAVPKTYHSCREMMQSHNQNVRYASMAAIAKLGGTDDLPILRTIAASTNNNNWPIRRMAVRAIGAIGTREDLAILGEIAKRNDGVKHLVGQTASEQSWRVAAREDPSLVMSNLRAGCAPARLTSAA